MSGMAKIFVVVNLILAVMTFGSAATLLGAQDNYKQAFKTCVEDYQKFQQAKNADIDRLRTENTSLVSKVSTTTGERDTAVQARQQTQVELSKAQEDAAAQRAVAEKLAEDVRQLGKVIEGNRASIESLTSSAQGATNDATNARKQLEEEVANRTRLETEVKNQADTIDEMTRQMNDLNGKLREANFWIKAYQERYGPLSGAMGQGAEGRVLEVKGNILGLSVGSDDKVGVGDVYNIRRGGDFVGSCKVVRVYKTQSVAEFDSVYTGPGAPPQAGDSVYPAR